MIDKLELRVPAETKFRREFETSEHDWRDWLRPARFYLGVADLRPLDHACLLHFRHRGTGDHKLELIDAGSFSLTSMIEQVERIFDVDPLKLNLMRLDLAADIEGVPVNAFVGNVRGKWKRASADIGRYTRIGKLGVETFYLGKRPNLFRFYNKIEESKVQYVALKRKMGGDIASFDQLFGYPSTGLTLTRVERQIGGGRIPGEIDTVEKLRTLPEFDPFDRLEIVAGSDVPPIPEEGGFSSYLKGLGLREFVRQHGLQNARRLANKLSSGNAGKIFKDYAAYLPSSGFQITEREIYERYRLSVSKQIAA